ncbi:MAG: DUF6058 family natural product biosynthesis protein [Candidatus Sphingomonas phytovorans]|nr:DUF6058 family natural product biosynthesis protein [Sphingomonas sp.]WEK02436.1 MAG: DUF6058 family natural product biosynthesis protein [Sphingomonas sp.]
MTNLAYIQCWFLTPDLFCRQIGAAPDLVERLVAAGAMPGPIYAEHDGVWWSALEATERPPPGRLWYAPAAMWWGRRALLGLKRGLSVEEATIRNRAHFIATFVEALAAEPLGILAFPGAFAKASVDPEGATRCAEAEWASWTDGGYAVCLRRFSGESCVRKESLARRIRHHMEQVPGYRLDDDALFDLVERLENLMLPFAPWQRRTGSPGRAVDAPLAAMGLGAEMPYDIGGL